MKLCKEKQAQKVLAVSSTTEAQTISSVVDNPPVIGMADNVDTINAVNTAKNAVQISSASVASRPTVPPSIVQPMVSQPEPVIDMKATKKGNITFCEYETARKASLKDQPATEEEDISTIHLGISSLKSIFSDPPLPPAQPVIVMMAHHPPHPNVSYVSSLDSTTSPDDNTLTGDDDTPNVDMIEVLEEQAPPSLVGYIDLELAQFPIPVTLKSIAWMVRFSWHLFHHTPSQLTEVMSLAMVFQTLFVSIIGVYRAGFHFWKRWDAHVSGNLKPVVSFPQLVSDATITSE
jgi:hypothetical protein